MSRLLQRQTGGGLPSSGTRRQRAGHRQRCPEETGGDEPVLPARDEGRYPYDTTPFVRVAINEVVKTLFEAILLVFLVMYRLHGKHPGHPDPTIAVPVVLLGTFAVLGLFGFSINMLTCSPWCWPSAAGGRRDRGGGEVERIMSEEGLSPREATAKSMEQIPAP